MTETTKTTKQNNATWSYVAGEKGRNRVRVFERGSQIHVDYKDENGKRQRDTMGHGDRELAKAQADEIAGSWPVASRPFAARRSGRGRSWLTSIRRK